MNFDIDDFLEHYGVKGMRWGVRRSGNSKASKKSGSAKSSADRKEVDELLKKPRRSLTNAELKKVNERLNLERNTQKLTSSGESFAKKLMKSASGANNAIALLKSPVGAAAVGVGAAAAVHLVSTSKAVGSIGKFA